MIRKLIGWTAFALGVGYYVWLFLIAWAHTLPRVTQ